MPTRPPQNLLPIVYAPELDFYDHTPICYGFAGSIIPKVETNIYENSLHTLELKKIT